MVEVKNLSHHFGGEPVLSDVSFRVDDAHIAVIMGSSGGGKTTLLKCIGGLIKPVEGEIFLNKIDVVKHADDAHREIGMVFQYAALFDSLSVKDNILFGLKRMRKLSKKDEEEIVANQLKNVGLKEVAEMMPSELSGGMRKRVGLARALCMEPLVLLYDEPTSGLDPVTAYSIDRLIVDTRERTQATSIIVSHDVNSILRVADQIIFLHEGKILFDGTVPEFRESNDPVIGDLVGKARVESF